MFRKGDAVMVNDKDDQKHGEKGIVHHSGRGMTLVQFHNHYKLYKNERLKKYETNRNILHNH